MEKEAAAVWMNVDSLVPWDQNPRDNDEAVPEVAESIKRFGFASPIIARKAGQKHQVIAGHTRLKAAKTIGLTSVPVRVMDLDPADAKLLALADNKVAEIAEWSDDLGPLLRELRDEGMVLEGLGWGEDELNELLAETLGDGGESEEVAPEVQEKIHSQEGVIYELGPHRLLCGDSTDMDAVSNLMGEKQADIFVSDPPYGVSYADKNEFLNTFDAGNRNQTPIESDHGTVEETADLWFDAFTVAFAITKPGGCYYLTGPQGGDLSMKMMMMVEKTGWLLKHCLIWVKNNHVLGRCDYNYKHEPILYGWKPGAGHYYKNNGDTSVWEIPRPLVSKEHPTMKPIEVMARMIRNGSKVGEIVFDPFMGSGTTLIAAAKHNRAAYGAELSPAYCDVIRRRWTRWAKENNQEPGSGALDE